MKQRKYTLHILGQEYSILSQLDEPTFAKVSDLLKEGINALPSGIKQDEKMILVCLQFAYTLHSLSEKCTELLRKEM